MGNVRCVAALSNHPSGLRQISAPRIMKMTRVLDIDQGVGPAEICHFTLKCLTHRH